MYTYTFFQWLLFFYIYCFVGWCIESSIVSIQSKKFVNRGFLRSPFLPLYGFGAIVMLFVSLPVRDSAFFVYLFGMAGATALEYFTGFIMELLFKVKYWDYSDQRFNIRGRICLMASLFWGFLSLFLTYILHKPVESFVMGIPNALVITADIVISVIFVSDTIYAFKTAFDVSRLLTRITAIRSQLDDLKAELSDKYETEKLNTEAYFERLKSDSRYAAVAERADALKKDLADAKAKFGYFRSELIKAHPNAKSSRFSMALSEVREYLENKKK